VRLRLSDAEDADHRRAIDLTRATPRALYMTAVSATLRDVERVSAVVRAAEQRDDSDLALAIDRLRAVEAGEKGARIGAADARTIIAALRHRGGTR
jgi:hypothetical protein